MNFVIHVNTVIGDEEGRVLLVREKKEKVFDKLNLPGGHLEVGEELVAGAKREAMEEVGVEIEIEGLIGIYSSRGENHYLNFVFAGKIIKGIPVANKNEINECGWYTMQEILELPEEQILNPEKLKKVMRAYQSGKLGGLGLIEENL